MSRPAGCEEHGHVGAGDVGITGNGGAVGWLARASRADARVPDLRNGKRRPMVDLRGGMVGKERDYMDIPHKGNMNPDQTFKGKRVTKEL
jgi:hypothetical protein